MLRDDSHSLTKALAEIGVRYTTRGKGRGTVSLLLKEDVKDAAKAHAGAAADADAEILSIVEDMHEAAESFPGD